MLPTTATEELQDDALTKLTELRKNIRRLAGEHDSLCSAVQEADQILGELEAQRRHLLETNRSLARAAAESAELVAEVEEKNRRLEEMNRELARANAHAAELIGEIEMKNEKIDILNRSLARANATAAELVAELELHREELEKANRVLKETNEEKGHIIGVVAHDLRSGIGGMSGLADLLAEEIPPDAGQVHEFVKLLQEESHRLLNLLSALLDMSRIEQGRLQLQLEIRDIRPLVSESVQYHRHFAELKNQQMQENLPDVALMCAYDPVRLRQVMDNLLSNAVKYSRQGTEITVRGKLESGCVVIEVLDRGPGLTAEDSTKIFRSFQQLSAKPTGGEDSHGLGLAIAKKVIESHNGKIWAVNRPDPPGAIFGFSLIAR